MKTLHITPHLGGGVGRVLLNYFAKVKDDQSFVHEVACLDYANDHALDMAKNIGLKLTDRISVKESQLLSMIAETDIVLIHWWNHPLLYDFLVRMELPPCRVVMWSHISGFHPPYVFTEKILRYPDIFVFTTPVSYETKEVHSLSDEQKKSLRVVWSTGGVEHVKDVKTHAHTGFNVGYIGTVDYCKMHPDFLSICSQVDIPDVKFIVCGGPKEKEIQQEAKCLGIDGKFTFTGLVNDITKYLSAFDVFGYPLALYHYGTCDQALAESMACGVVPVVFSNRMENQMVQDGVTGIVVNSKEEYGNAIEKLYGNKELRMHLSENAKEYARNSFSLKTLKHEWEKVFEEMLAFPKSVRKWENSKPKAEISAKDVFLESLGEYGQEFKSYCNAVSVDEKETHSKKIKKLAESAIWQARTRGTAHHYKEFFPDDEHLAVWSRLMKEHEPCNEKGERCR
ncbi:MAG: glycosyltransferase family 4 protein [Proteobacteria bacterium]|nr:glycosyltransferase family 4 protein [Pseudomonadota bacterium]MBU4009170.1 glycosyltransferase family 4 protein [Pseudomonadota bacterium]